jgi:hypothetical protein
MELVVLFHILLPACSSTSLFITFAGHCLSFSRVCIQGHFVVLRSCHWTALVIWILLVDFSLSAWLWLIPDRYWTRRCWWFCYSVGCVRLFLVESHCESCCANIWLFSTSLESNLLTVLSRVFWHVSENFAGFIAKNCWFCEFLRIYSMIYSCLFIEMLQFCNRCYWLAPALNIWELRKPANEQPFIECCLISSKRCRKANMFEAVSCHLLLLSLCDLTFCDVG